MAKQIINIGSSANQGDGDPLRVAFDKINDNFDELYARDLNTDAQTLTLVGDTLSISDGNSVTIPYPTDFDLKGSVFADDSTLLVDGVNGVIPTSVLQGDITNPIRTGDVVIESTTSPGSVTITHAGIGGITLDASTSINGIELLGPVDFTNATITMPQYISIADLKTLVADSTDFEDFQTRIAAL